MTAGPVSARSFLFDKLKAILGDEGLALRDNFYASTEQRDYSQRWCEAIIRSIEHKATDRAAPTGIVLSSADTGTGKTIGYGVPLLLRASMGVKVGISTHTHALQRQFLGTPARKGDLVTIAGWIQELGLGNLSIRRRMGRQSFVSLGAVEHLAAKMHQERNETHLTLEQLRQIDPIIEFAMESNAGKSYASGLIEDLLDELGGELPLGITPASICLGLDSSEEDSYRYTEHLEDAEAADVVIFSHAYLAACALYRRGQLLESPIDSLVIDEADRLVDVASSAYRFELSLHRCHQGIAKHAGKSGQAAVDAVRALAEHVQSLHTNNSAIALDTLRIDVHANTIALASQAHKAITTLIAKLKTKGEVSPDVMREFLVQEAIFAKVISSSNARLNAGAPDSGGHFVSAVSFSPVQSLPSIAAMPTHPGYLLSRLWSVPLANGDEEKTAPLNSVLLTSATLGVPGHYSDAKERFSGIAVDCGIFMKASPGPMRQRPEFDLWGSFEPEKFGRIRYILADPSTPSPTADLDENSNAVLNPDWSAYALSMIMKAKQSGGRTLVLCSSYKDVATFSAALLAAGVTEVIEQMRGGSSKECQERFVESKNGIWLSPTAWEGINLPGVIRNLVVLRIPFTGLDTTSKALMESMGRYTHTAIGKILQARQMGNTKRKMRQGFGRPIRSRTDQASIWIADPRFPIHPGSQIPLRFPGAIRYSGAKTYKAMHAIVPRRFQRALENASVLLKSGELLR